MNRQYKRAMQKQEAQKQKGGQPKSPRPAPGAPGTRQRTKPREFVKEVIAELRKVHWPNREEVTAYSLVVLVSVIVIASIIWALDWMFSKAIISLFGIHT